MRGRGGPPPPRGRHSSYTPSDRGGAGPNEKRHSGYSNQSPLREADPANGTPPRSLPKAPSLPGVRRSGDGSLPAPPLPSSAPPPPVGIPPPITEDQGTGPARNFSPLRSQPQSKPSPPLMRKNGPNQLKAQLGGAGPGSSPGSGPGGDQKPPTALPRFGQEKAGGPRPLPKFGEVTVDDAAGPDPPPRSPPTNRYPRLPPREPEEAKARAPAQQASPGSVPAPAGLEKGEAEGAASTAIVPTPAPAPGGKMTKSQQRQNVLKEMYETEVQYVEDLETLISVFIIPLRAMELVSDQVIYAIFSNVEVLLGCNKEMAKELEKATNNGTKDGDQVQVGQCFTKLADYFKMYKVYSANQQVSLTTVEQQSKKNSRFKSYVDVCHSDPRCQGLFLQSFLIKPIQRVCKYPLLLRELIKFTPEEHPDHEHLTKAFEKINEVVANINEGQREAEGLQRIIDLQKLIDGIDSLVAPGRRLHKEGDLMYYKSAKTKHPEKRHVFFFSDLIMLTTKKGDKKFEHKMSVPLEDCKLIVLADSQYIKNAFELHQKQVTRHKCILSDSSADEIKFWVKEIKTLIREYQRKRLRELAEAKKKMEQMTALSTAN